jgi:hypothetical protein
MLNFYNCLVILGARIIWNHRNRFVFEGCNPNLVRQPVAAGAPPPGREFVGASASRNNRGEFVTDMILWIILIVVCQLAKYRVYIRSLNRPLQTPNKPITPD